MVFKATFNNISAISWQSVLLVEETGVPRENHWPVTNHNLLHVMKTAIACNYFLLTVNIQKKNAVKWSDQYSAVQTCYCYHGLVN
jgi:hypothetical protein